MRKFALISILVAGCIQNSFAQNETGSTEKKEKSTDQYIGVQLNDLVRQVFNFNNSATSTNVNPYLFTYSIDSRKTKWGIRFGAGYNYNSSWNNDGVTETSSKINDMQFRLGIEKVFKLSDKWSAGAGADIILNSNDDNTTSIVRSFDTTTTTTKTTMSSYGGGPAGWLRYNITSKILIGTEASFYYVSGKQNSTTDVSMRSFSGGFPITKTTETTSNPTISTGTFNSPIVFYLMVRF